MFLVGFIKKIAITPMIIPDINGISLMCFNIFISSLENIIVLKQDGSIKLSK